MSDETSRELLASLTATLAELETGASGSDPTAAARAFDAMMQRRRLERDRAAKAALAEATRPPERPWFDEALPPRYPTKESCSECGTSPLPASRTLPCGHPANACRECLDRKLLDGATARARGAARPSARPSPARSSSRRRARTEPTPSRESSAYSSTEPTTPVSAKRPEARDAASVSEAPDARVSAGATPLMIACDFDAVDAARVLLTAGASTSARDAEGLTPLHRACWRGSSACARTLLDFGADRTRRTTRRRRPRWSPRGSTTR